MRLSCFLSLLIAGFLGAWLVLFIWPVSYLTREPLPEKKAGTLDGGSLLDLPRPEMIAAGARVYAEEGCAACHTQVIRSSPHDYFDLWKTGWAGRYDEQVDFRRASSSWDYVDEIYAPFGAMRIGPDLSNLSWRIDRLLEKKDPDGNSVRVGSSELWLYAYLLNPQNFHSSVSWSICPARPDFFEEKPWYGKSRIYLSLPVEGDAQKMLVPTQRARQLVLYLLSLKKDGSFQGTNKEVEWTNFN